VVDDGGHGAPNDETARIVFDRAIEVSGARDCVPSKAHILERDDIKSIHKMNRFNVIRLSRYILEADSDIPWDRKAIPRNVIRL
jgi:hypothetical protein